MSYRHLMLLAAAGLSACATQPEPAPSMADAMQVHRTETRQLKDGHYEVRTFNRAGHLMDIEVLPKWSRT